MLRREVLEQLHDHLLGAGHPGIGQTRLAVPSLYWRPYVVADIEVFAKLFAQCARGKSPHQKSAGLSQPLPIPNVAWEESSIDLITELPVTEDGLGIF